MIISLLQNITQNAMDKCNGAQSEALNYKSYYKILIHITTLV